MANIELWKLVIDAGLLLSCVVFLFALTRTSKPAYSTSHLTDLNSKLQTVIREADETGKTLNQQLMRRQEQLEKILFDVESVESRLNRLLASSDEKKSTLDIELGKAKQIISQLTADVERTQELHKEVAKDRDLLRALVDLPKDETQYSGIAYEEAQPIKTQNAAPAIVIDAEPALEEPPPDWSTVNIFGESVKPAAQVQPAAAQVFPKKRDGYIPLEKTIEKKVTAEARPEPELEQLTEVYNAAENLLRAGSGLDKVAQETNLPLEEVRMLKRILDQEKDMQAGEPKQDLLSVNTGDERLGVLGALRRHVPFL